MKFKKSLLITTPTTTVAALVQSKTILQLFHDSSLGSEATMIFLSLKLSVSRALVRTDIVTILNGGRLIVYQIANAFTHDFYHQ